MPCCNVKGVPLLYLPFLYYPTKKEDRATGFLLPTYGVTTLRGQSLSNAFFWAIDRSQDATFMHDWYSKTGQGVGGEYRYALSSGNANFETYMLRDNETEYSTGVLEAATLLSFPGQRHSAAAGPPAVDVSRGLSHEHSDRPDLHDEHLRHLALSADVWRQPDRVVALLLAERHLRAHRVLHATSTAPT